MLLPVVFYEYSHLWASGLMLFKIYTKSTYFHRVKVSVELQFLKKFIVTPDFCHLDFKCFPTLYLGKRFNKTK